MASMEKVFPTVEELSKINKNLNCPECSATFNSESNLNLHLARTHKRPNLLQPNNSNKVYHCPISTCTYNDSSYFKQLKLLKQHYLKVHCEKNYICSLCKKGFSTEATRNRHSEYCDVVFKCCDCEMFYECYETLKTHCRRKKHNILEKVAYKTTRPIPILKNPKSENSLCSNKMHLLLPKSSSSMNMIIITNASEQSCQTERHTNHSNQETQTLLKFRIPQLTVETQTIGDYFTKKCQPTNSALKSARTQTSNELKCVSVDLTEPNLQRNSSSTQTTVCTELEDLQQLLSDANFCSMETQTDCIFNSSTDALLSVGNFDGQKNSSSTQTNINNDISDLLTDTFDSNYFNCNIETQTDFTFNDQLFKYCDDSTNMYTQTCEDLLLGLNDTHTQTFFDDLLKSVESQTIISQSRKPFFSCREKITHMETQTDVLHANA